MPRMTSRKLFLTASLIGAVLALAACGGSDSAGDSPPTVPADVDLVVDAGPGLKFDPDSYTAAAGPLTVSLVNKDSQLHSLVIVDSDKRTLPGELKVNKSGDVDTGEYDLTAGSYQLLCLVPGHEDMTATLAVD